MLAFYWKSVEMKRFIFIILRFPFTSRRNAIYILTRAQYIDIQIFVGVLILQLSKVHLTVLITLSGWIFELDHFPSGTMLYLWWTRRRNARFTRWFIVGKVYPRCSTQSHEHFSRGLEINGTSFSEGAPATLFLILRRRVSSSSSRCCRASAALECIANNAFAKYWKTIVSTSAFLCTLDASGVKSFARPDLLRLFGCPTPILYLFSRTLFGLQYSNIRVHFFATRINFSSIHFFIYLSIYLSICLSVYLSIYIYSTDIDLHH